MTIKFLLDRVQKEQDETIEKILEFVKKKPYPDEETRHLALFTHALFKAGMEQSIKHPEEVKKKVEEVAKTKVRMRPLPPAPKPHYPPQESMLSEEPIVPDSTLMPMEPPKPSSDLPPLEFPELNAQTSTSLPSQEKPQLRGKEYMVTTFNTPIGIVIDVKNNKPNYKAVEPLVNKTLVLSVMNSIRKDFGKNYKVLDDDAFLKKRIEATCAKLKIKFEPDMIRKVRYYLKRDLMGFRRIDVLMQDMKVEGIYVDGVNKPVMIEVEGYPKKMETNIMFHTSEELNDLLVRLAKATGVELTDANPILDTTFQEFKIQGVKGAGGASSRLTIKKVMGNG